MVSVAASVRRQPLVEREAVHFCARLGQRAREHIIDMPCGRRDPDRVVGVVGGKETRVICVSQEGWKEWELGSQ